MLKKRLRAEVDTNEAESQADVVYVKTSNTLQSQSSLNATLINNYSSEFRFEGSSGVGGDLSRPLSSNFVDVSFKYY